MPIWIVVVVVVVSSTTLDLTITLDRARTFMQSGRLSRGFASWNEDEIVPMCLWIWITIVFNKFDPVYRFTGLVTNLTNQEIVKSVKQIVISQKKKAPAGAGGPSGMFLRTKT